MRGEDLLQQEHDTYVPNDSPRNMVHQQESLEGTKVTVMVQTTKLTKELKSYRRRRKLLIQTII